MRAMKSAALEKRSITVSMVVVLPSDGGRPVTKSRAMWDQGRLGMGRGRSRPERGRVEVLFRAQVAHAAIKERTSCVHSGPPESPADEVQRAGDSRVAGEPGGMSPGQYPGPYSVWNEQTDEETGTGVWLLPLRKVYSGLNLPGEYGDQTSGWQDGFGVCTGVLGGVQAGQGIRLNILGAGTIGEGEIKTTEE